MASVPDNRLALAAAVAPPVIWRGRSGQGYALTPLRLEDFSLEPGGLYVVARGTLVLWAGSSADVIDDAQSRARFRLALTCADRAFRVAAPDDGVERMTVIWDLEGAGPATDLARDAA